MKTSQIGLIPNIGKQRGSCADYNANNTWYFNGTNGCVNNNNRYNANFRSRPVLDYCQYDNELLEQYPLPLSQMYLISRRAEKGKHGKPSYVFFSLHRIEELVRLTHEINNFEILPREGTAHTIFEPRIRQIVCAAAGDRDIQTFYIMQMQPYLEQYMYHDDSYSCRPKKGGLKAIKQLQDYIYEVTDGYTKEAWLVKRDIQAFFMNIDCFLVYEIMIRFIDKHMAGHPYFELLKYLTRVIYLAATKDHIKDMSHPYERQLLDPKKSIYNNPYYKGVPIGNWPSQTAGLVITSPALFYESSLGYTPILYSDDKTTIITDKKQWKEDELRIERFYRDKCHLTIHPKKRYMQHYSKGIELLGYKLCYNRILPSDRIYHNIHWYLTRTIKKAALNKRYTFVYRDNILSSVNSYLSLLKHMSAYKLRREICKRIMDSEIGNVFDISPDYTKITVKQQYTTKSVYKLYFKQLKKHLKNNYYEIR